MKKKLRFLVILFWLFPDVNFAQDDYVIADSGKMDKPAVCGQESNPQSPSISCRNRCSQAGKTTAATLLTINSSLLKTY